MAIQDQIRAAASKNDELLRILAETDRAPGELEQQNVYLKDLEKDKIETEKRLKELHQRTQIEQKEYERYRDSTMKRFAYRLGRKTEKFEQRASKEEREYFEALQQENEAKERLKYLNDNIEKARAKRNELQPTAKRHADAQAELDKLYNQIFSGPTPDFPGEDEVEQHCQQMHQRYQDVERRLNSEMQAANFLLDAELTMKRALVHIDEARQHSRMDMFGGGTISDMMERSALQRTQACVAQATQLVSQAQRFSPSVTPLPHMSVAQGNLLGDVLFDSFFSDVQFHEKIKQSQNQILYGTQSVGAQIKDAHKRIAAMTEERARKSEELKAARKALQDERQAIFEKALRDGQS